ncbi:uncharacterized protein TNCV_221221 [Trichonephila clavipes]|nr:uncharacterized protein TNCV_221221 [Trichonephila clavipes]
MSRYSITIKVIIAIIGLIRVQGLGILGGGRCGTGEWSCYSLDQGLRCIPLNKFCDGIRNCPDGSDEPPDCTINSPSKLNRECYAAAKTVALGNRTKGVQPNSR